MIVPELKERGSDDTYLIQANSLTWALEYAFNLGKDHGQIGEEHAARMVVQSLAGRNYIRLR